MALMKASKKLRKATKKALKRIVHRLEELALACVQAGQRSMRARQPARQKHAVPEHADEKTRRRMAEAEGGGSSSAESDARWQSGDNPGGTHHRSVRREGPEHPRPEQEEPQGRKEREPRGERHMGAVRRGA